MNTEIRELIRKDDRTPIGALVAIKKGNNVYVGWSLCNEKDHFERKFGFKIAKGRALNGSNVEIPVEVKSYFCIFRERCESYFKVPSFHVFVPTKAKAKAKGNKNEV